MTKILLVPGLDGSGPAHWQAWWAATDPRAILLDWRDPARPEAADWEAELAGAVLHHPGAVLVGHSLGAITIARLLARWPDLPVAGALLVAPADPAQSERTCGFGALPDRRLPVPATLVASRNDPWLGYARAERLAGDLGARLVDLGPAGHINVASGFGPWARGKALASGLLGRLDASDLPELRPEKRAASARRPAIAEPAIPAPLPSRAAVWGRCYG
ncbi:alpha/beta hydrolase [Frigidibacter sp. MR17.14]|uniref:RBBP9/YdeN family alpha/beta hydrolase n=1 Tax=Frigidibacter sp. MR17.14 TaxID=3126509 RepID=UPI003012FE41